MTAAAQICHRVALTSQLRLEKQIQYRKLKNIASILSNAILEFWSSVEVPGELEETNLGINKVFDCRPLLWFLMAMVIMWLFPFL